MSTRKCEIVQQIKYLPGYPSQWKETLEDNLNANSNIKFWAYILHSKDVDEDGNTKEPHVHIVIELVESRQYSTVGGYVGVPAQYVCAIRQKVKVGKRMMCDIGGALSYLTHRNAPDRYQYSDDEVVAKPGYNWKAVRAKSEMSMAERKTFQRALEGIQSGKIRRYNLHDYVSMAMYLEHKVDFERAFEYRELELKRDANRHMEVIYITGAPGAGKTTLAKHICVKRGLSYCVSGSSRDPVQDYNGQDCLILDDLRPQTFDISDLLKMLDNNTGSSVNSRYHDRWLEVTRIIITTVLPVDDFFRQIFNPAEPIAQFKRRCRTMIQLSKQQMSIYMYHTNAREYMLVGVGDNPVSAMFKPEEDTKDSEKTKELCKDLGVEFKPECLPSDYLE